MRIVIDCAAEELESLKEHLVDTLFGPDEDFLEDLEPGCLEVIADADDEEIANCDFLVPFTKEQYKDFEAFLASQKDCHCKDKCPCHSK